MKPWMIFLACAAVFPLAADASCGDSQARQHLAWKSAVEKHRDTISPEPYTLKELQTAGGGYSYQLYFDTKPRQKHARSVLVVMDETCKVLHVDETPRESRLILTSGMK
jgi:hypothetical protein